MSNLIKALQIFLKYKDDPYPTNCDHDVLRVCIDPEIVSTEDKTELETLGFRIDDYLGCFYSFRYGSN